MSSGKSRRRPVVYPIRLSDAELAAAKANADTAGQAVAAYIRDMATKGRPGRNRASRTIAELAKLVGALGKIGNNLNQLAHEANTGRFPGAGRIEAALGELAALREQIAEVIDAL